VGDDKPTLFGIDRRNIGEKHQKTFESRGFAVGLARSETQSISAYRSRTYIPELNDVLRRHANAITRAEKAAQRRGRVQVHGVTLVNTAQQNVGIGEVLHESLFVIGSVEGFPADRVVR